MENEDRNRSEFRLVSWLMIAFAIVLFSSTITFLFRMIPVNNSESTRATGISHAEMAEFKAKLKAMNERADALEAKFNKSENK